MKILLAEDDPISLRMMERALRQSGYEVITVNNGRDAADILADPDGPRLALIDWVMPELDGPGVCREVRNRHRESYVYILLLTAKQTTEDTVNGLAAGADDYLTKPCHPGELEARLHTGRRILLLEDKLVEAREDMRYKATHDPLTSLWDRGAILGLLRSELSRSTRAGTPVSLLLCDVDRFKNVNDTYGHLAGDEVLRETATRLSRSVRGHDAIGRYGGEEFLMVLSDCGHNDIRERADDIRRSISRAPFFVGQHKMNISLSIGAITLSHWDQSIPIERFLSEADAALYRAKAAGRNCVIHSDSPAPYAMVCQNTAVDSLPCLSSGDFQESEQAAN